MYGLNKKKVGLRIIIVIRARESMHVTRSWKACSLNRKEDNDDVARAAKFVLCPAPFLQSQSALK